MGQRVKSNPLALNEKPFRVKDEFERWYTNLIQVILRYIIFYCYCCFVRFICEKAGWLVFLKQVYLIADFSSH